VFLTREHVFWSTRGVWFATSVRPDMIFGKDSGDGAGTGEIQLKLLHGRARMAGQVNKQEDPMSKAQKGNKKETESGQEPA
jgi:hypothetical protein